MKIPYNEELRPDTGLYNAKLGIWLFLASEVMLFGGLFSAYILLRVSDPNWMSYTMYSFYVDLPHFNDWFHGNTTDKILKVPLATLNTVILITSSVTMVMSWVSLKLNDFKKYKIYMGATLLCSFGFKSLHRLTVRVSTRFSSVGNDRHFEPVSCPTMTKNENLGLPLIFAAFTTLVEATSL